MKNRSRRFAIVVVGLAIAQVGAEPPRTAEALIGAGNEAFARGEIETAETLYQQAEERSSDPGLVAFNKGATQFRRGDFRRAEMCFRRTLGDAAIPAERRGRALYNLGNCLVRQAGDTETKLLQAAIDSFELTVRETTDDGLRADAAHNLEVAKLLWAKARSRKPPDERDPEWDEPKDPSRPPADPNKKDNSGAQDMGDGSKQPETGAKLEPGKGQNPGVAPKETPKAVPGQGNLPVLPDTGEVPSLSFEDARAELKRTADRLQRERQKLREEAAQGERIRANDW
jgi:tetratricopeptide (TPR) repeat protein